MKIGTHENKSIHSILFANTTFAISTINKLSEEEEFTSCVSSGHQALYRLQTGYHLDNRMKKISF
jgi:hypothetical protein